MNRIYHPYTSWECYQNGMYVNRLDNSYVFKSIELLSNKNGILEAMNYVAFNWKHSSENFLTDIASNRKAWIGQAACCFEHGATELETCKAWWELSEDQRFMSNAIADQVINEWEEEKIGVSKCLKLDLD